MVARTVGVGRREVSVRLDCIVFALFHLGIVPGILVFVARVPIPEGSPAAQNTGSVR